MSDQITDRPKPRQKRAQITRDKICEATIQLLGSGGAKAVTNRAVAKAAGVSLASTTYHFQNKDDLLTGAFEWLIDNYTKTDRSKLDETVGDDLSIDALTAHIISVSQLGMSRKNERTAICAWYEFMVEASRNPDIQDTADRWYRDTCAHYQHILEMFGSRSPKEDTRRLVDFLIGYEMMALATQRSKFDRRGIEQTYRRFVASLFDADHQEAAGPRE